MGDGPHTPAAGRTRNQEEVIQLLDLGTDPQEEGEIRNNGGALKAQDSVGVFDLRGGGGVAFAPPVTLAPNGTNTEGTSPAAARADHVHRVGSGALATDLILVTDGAGGFTTQAAPGEAFGAEINEAEDAAESTTTSGTYQQKLRLSVTGIPTGEYILLYSWVIRSSNAALIVQTRLQLDDTTTIVEELVKPGAQGPSAFVAGQKVLMGLSGDHDFDVDWRKDSGGSPSSTANIASVRLTFWRIS